MVATQPTVTEGEIEEEDGETRETRQTRITVPKGLAEALDVAANRWEWEIKSRDRIELKRVDG